MQAHFLISFFFKPAPGFPSPSHLFFWTSFFVSLLKLHCFVHLTFFHTITPKYFFSAALPSHCLSFNHVPSQPSQYHFKKPPYCSRGYLFSSPCMSSCLPYFKAFHLLLYLVLSLAGTFFLSYHWPNFTAALCPLLDSFVPTLIYTCYICLQHNFKKQNRGTGARRWDLYQDLGHT